jgi:hypothetical protein
MHLSISKITQGKSMKNSQQKIFFDVSSLIDYVSEHSCYSGIQRVVAVLVSEFSKIVDPRLLYISFLGTDGRHKCVDFAKIGTDGILSPKLMASMFYKNIDNLKHPSLKGYHDQYLKYHFHKIRTSL